MDVHFYKYQGTGNDFILLDNRHGEINTLPENVIAGLCHRRFGIGADGLMLLGSQEGCDFRMDYYNADGAAGSMCGNGARCIVRFAHDLGIDREIYHFIAPDGDHQAQLLADGRVRLWMSDVEGVEQLPSACVLDTGSPHFVRFVEGLRELDVDREGRAIRHSERFAEKGINVNFVERLMGDTLFVRTFERGVEAETYSCGTGVTASALSSKRDLLGAHRIEVETLGGKLVVEFEHAGGDVFRDIRLLGPATFVFRGTIDTASIQ